LPKVLIFAREAAVDFPPSIVYHKGRYGSRPAGIGAVKYANDQIQGAAMADYQIFEAGDVVLESRLTKCGGR
jgi:ketosteroid isomerase-like protein